jgi:hypothetical protein
MVCHLQPTAWRINRTVLIPKEGKDLSQVTNYRPITIGSILSRIYWGIIDSKLRSVFSFSPRQKGFVHDTGCFNNVHIFNEILKSAKRRKGLTAIQLDITKAFDTIPHESIEAALGHLGVPLPIREAISRSYVNLKTTIEHRGTKIEIPIRRGVKQGDPLSPFLFNAILDPLLDRLEQRKGFDIDGPHNISTIAFADDLMLLATSKDDAQALLRLTESYLKDLGMRIAAGKCATFSITTTRDSWYVSNPGLTLDSGETIPFSSAESTLLYLGGHISPWSGLQYRDLVTQL